MKAGANNADSDNDSDEDKAPKKSKKKTKKRASKRMSKRQSLNPPKDGDGGHKSTASGALVLCFGHIAAHTHNTVFLQRVFLQISLP